MNLNARQLAHILAALRCNQGKDLSAMPHFDEGIEPLAHHGPLQGRVERMPRVAQLLVRHEQRLLLRPPSPHRHAVLLANWRRVRERSMATFTTGC